MGGTGDGMGRGIYLVTIIYLSYIPCYIQCKLYITGILLWRVAAVVAHSPADREVCDSNPTLP